MLFKKKCPICGAKNPKDAITCASCGAPFELRQAEGQIAIKDFHEAVRLNPQDAEAYYNRGNAYSGLGQYKRAIQDFDEAIRLNPQDAEAYNNRGNAYSSLGQDEWAFKDFDKAIRLAPNLDVAYYNRGIAYRKLGQKAEAIADFEKCITLTTNPQLIEMVKRQIEELSK